MRLEDVVDLHAALERRGLPVWIDGGWGVDALLGEQTRLHRDLDVAIRREHVAGLLDVLRARGYRVVERADTTPWNFVLGDDHGREVDVHVIVLDGDGNGILGPPENGDTYPAAALAGRGTVAGRAVRCISPEWAVKFHCAYAPAAKDVADVTALCRRFGLPLPKEYERFRTATRPGP